MALKYADGQTFENDYAPITAIDYIGAGETRPLACEADKTALAHQGAITEATIAFSGDYEFPTPFGGIKRSPLNRFSLETHLKPMRWNPEKATP